MRFRVRGLRKGVLSTALLVGFAVFAAACGSDDESSGGEATDDGSDVAETGDEPAESEDEAAEGDTDAADTDAADSDDGASAGESLDADPALLAKALGSESTEGVDEVVLAAIARAGNELDDATTAKALECWEAKTCDTGTGGELTVALADGFGENVWREVTHMEFVLQALTYPEIGEIIYTSAQGDTQKAISDFRSLISQEVDVIVTFADAGEALLPTAQEATAQGIQVVPYIGGVGGAAGEDYLTFVAEDLCQLGINFAGILNEEVGTGKVAFLGGTPGNPLSAAWQGCEEPELAETLELVGTADTNWTQEGTLQAVSSLLAEHPDLAGISYEYADGFLGGVRAYEAANQSLDLVLTLRTDEVGLFCEWAEIGNPDFEIYFSSGGGFDPRIALTAAMMAIAGEEVPTEVVVPAQMRQVTEADCNPVLPSAAPASTLVPTDILDQMYG